MTRAVYAGSFDPLTHGHLWMIEAGCGLFDELIVAIGVNPDKRATFSIADRKAMLTESTVHLAQRSKIHITHFENQFLVRYAQSVDAQYILRGIRTSGDYEFERTMRHINADIAPDVTVLFLMPPRAIAEVSSTMVKGLVGVSGWEDALRAYVPEPVRQRLISANGSTASARI